MTEAEWLVSDDSPNWRSGLEAYFDSGSYQNKVGRMLRCLDGRSTQRKLLLFALFCYGQNEDLFPDIRQRRAFALAESRVDGTVTDQDRRAALLGVADAYEAMSTDGDFDEYLYAPAQVLEPKFTVRFAEALSDLAGHSRDGEDSFDGQSEELFRDQIVLLRDIFGNPFRPVTFIPAWLTSTAVGIARGIYDDRAFDRLPILADALQDAGCEDANVLGHCRGDGPHVRGCWVVDGVLGKK